MFHEMRRKRQELSVEEAIAILERNDHGVLALQGEEAYPYAVPVNHLYYQGKLYFHGTKQGGHRLEVLRQNAYLSYCVIDHAELVPEEVTAYFRSVILFGRARLLETKEEQMAILQALGERYSGDFPEAIAKTMEKEGPYTMVVEVNIDHMTAKESIELVRAREGSVT